LLYELWKFWDTVREMLVKLEILVSGKKGRSFSKIVLRNEAFDEVKIVTKLKNVLLRSLCGSSPGLHFVKIIARKL